MLIPLSIGSLRIACAAARAAAVEGSLKDREAIAEKAFAQLHDGAVHNGMNPSAAELETMRGMVERDVEHAMEQHPSQHIVKHIDTMIAMADYVDATDSYAEVVIDTLEFQLLRDHLPTETKKED